MIYKKKLLIWRGGGGSDWALHGFTKPEEKIKEKRKFATFKKIIWRKSQDCPFSKMEDMYK
jgi:hypothetical protein